MLCHTMNLFCNTLGVASVTPNGIFVAPLRCSFILEGRNEALHNVVTELHRQELSYYAGVCE